MKRRNVLQAALALPLFPLGLSQVASPALASFALGTENFGHRLVAASVDIRTNAPDLLSILHRLANNVDVEKIWDDWFGWSDDSRLNSEEMFYSLIHEMMVYPEYVTDEARGILAHMRSVPDLLERPMTVGSWVTENGDEYEPDQVGGASIDDVVVLLNDSGERWSIKAGPHVVESGV